MTASIYNRPRSCVECGDLYQPRHEHKNYAARFCSRECAKVNVTRRKRAHWPTEAEMRQMVYAEHLADSAIGGRYGHSYEWARRIRNHYRIPAQARPPHREIKHGRYIGLTGFSVKAKGEAACRACGATPTGTGPMGALHLHHAIPRSMCKATKTDLRNGIPLCRACHAGWHDRQVTIYRDAFTVAEWAFLLTVDLLGQEVGPWLDRHYPVRP